ADNEKAKRGIEDITRDMLLLELQSVKTGKATAGGLPPPPGPTAKALTDMTKALDAYNKALASVAKAGADALAAIQLNAIKSQQADLERSYSEGLVDFKTYWDKRVELQNAALDVEESKLRAELTAQQAL